MQPKPEVETLEELAELLATPPTLLRDGPLQVTLCGPGPHDYRAVRRSLLREAKQANIVRYYGWDDHYMYFGPPDRQLLAATEDNHNVP